jgi:hypothetical protein
MGRERLGSDLRIDIFSLPLYLSPQIKKPIPFLETGSGFLSSGVSWNIIFSGNLPLEDEVMTLL